MNKNDLRFQKTEKLIKSTYLSLKKRADLPVKVTELCDAAMINKTTFYAHYETIEHLHKTVCREIATEMISKSDCIIDIHTGVSDFVYSILNVFVENTDVIKKLYGDDMFSLINDAESFLMEYYAPLIPDHVTELQIRFCIGGAARLLLAEQDPERIAATVGLVEKIME